MKFNKQKIRTFFGKKRNIIIFSILLALFIFRLFLPAIVKKYVNKALNNIPGYYGWVDDIDISLYRGAYVINGLHLYEKNSDKQFLDLDVTDISIQMAGIVQRRNSQRNRNVQSKINLWMTGKDVKDESGKKPSGGDWTKALDKIVPIKINRFVVHNGEFLYADVVESPDINLSLKKIELTATNLRSVVDKSQPLPSKLDLSAVSFGNGQLTIKGALNMLKEIPDMDINLSLKKSDATALNDLTMATAGFDFEKGQFELYSEAAVSNGHLKGYIKPMFHNITIPDSFKKKSSLLKRAWEGVVTFFGFVLKNKGKDSFATKIPVEGDLNDPNINIWQLIGNIFRNGFIKAFQNQVDEDIQFGDVGKDKKKNDSKKKDEKKEDKKKK
ncbi:MAG: DUF748 domain-containing protein [Chitinophagaceae bacterium]